MTRTNWRWVAILAVAAMGCGGAWAEEPAKAPAAGKKKAKAVKTEEPVAVLPEVVVTALRSERNPAEVPYASQTVDRDAIRQTSPRTSADALRGLPSVMVQKTGYGQGSPFLRGFTGFRTLMMVDGVRLNNSTFREGPNQYWTTVDPWSVDRYEVVLGPASVLYGSDAVGGAMNALTLAPPAWAGKSQYDYLLSYRGATADRSTQLRAGLAARVTQQLGLVGGITWKDFNDVRGGRDVGRQWHTDYGEWDWDLRADYGVRADTVLTLAHQQVAQDDAWRTHKTYYGIDWEGLKCGDDQVHSYDQDRALTYLRLAAVDRPGPISAYNLTLSRQTQAEDLDRRRADSRFDETGFDVATWGATLALESKTPVGHWVYGLDYYRDNVDSYGRHYQADGTLAKVDAQGPVADDAAYDLLGVFAQDTLPLFDGALELTPGVRYTWAALDANQVLDPVTGEVTARDDDWDSVVGSLRALAPLGAERRHAVYAGVSQGFRAPNLSDLTRLDGARSTEIETPVDSLDPERFVSAEAGARWQGDRLSAELACYYTWIEDMIVRAPTGRVIDELDEVTKKNAGDGYLTGVELTVGCRIADDWRVRLMGSWMGGKVDAYPTSDPVQVRDYVSRLMPLTGQGVLRWQPAGKSYWLEGVVDAAAKADRLSADDERDTQRIPPGGTPGYVVFTLRGGVTLAEVLDLTLALENVADEDYRIHGSGVNEPGRNLVLQADLKF